MGMEWERQTSTNDPIPDQLTVSQSRVEKTEIIFYLKMFRCIYYLLFRFADFRAMNLTLSNELRHVCRQITTENLNSSLKNRYLTNKNIQRFENRWKIIKKQI